MPRTNPKPEQAEPIVDGAKIRLKELRDEFAAGQKMLVDLENKQNELKTTLLRISGAIQALEELIGERTVE